MDDNTLNPTSEQFTPVGEVIFRASLLLDRQNAADVTGPEIAHHVKLAAYAKTVFVRDFLGNLASPEGDVFAQKLGWPSADALKRFVFKGDIAPKGTVTG